MILNAIVVGVHAVCMPLGLFPMRMTLRMAFLIHRRRCGAYISFLHSHKERSFEEEKEEVEDDGMDEDEDKPEVDLQVSTRFAE